MPVPVISATMHIQTKLPVIASTPECALNPPLAAAIAPARGLVTTSKMDTAA